MNKQTMLLAVLLCLLGVSVGYAQQAEPSEAPAPAEAPALAPADTPGIQPIPPAQIADRALAVAALLRNAEIESDFSAEVKAIGDDYSSTKRQIEQLQAESLRRPKTGGPVSLIEEAEKEWSRIRGRLNRWMATLSARADAVGSVLRKIRAEKALWMLTRDLPSAEELPLDLHKMIDEVVESIEKAEQQAKSSRDSILNLQVSIGDAKVLADQVLADQGKEIRERRRQIISIDSEPLWAAYGTPGAGWGLFGEISKTARDNLDSVRKYVSEQRADWIKYLATLAALVAFLIFLRQKGRVWVLQDRSLEPALSLLERPVAAGIILVALLGELLHPDSPAAWSAVLGLLLLFGLLRLLPRILVPTNRAWAYILATLFFLQQVAKLTPDGTLLHRVVLLFLSLAGYFASVWLLRKAGPGRSTITPGWLRAIRVVARCAAALFVVGSIANIVGSVGFAMVVVTGTLHAILASVVLLVVATLMRALVRVVMLLPSVRRFGIVSQRGETTRQTLFQAITAAAVIVWVTVALKGFTVIDPVRDALKAAASAEISIGSFTVTPADLLIFVLAIWVSFKLSRLICFALEADVLPHMELPRGVPGAVTRLTHYSVIVIGVIVAFSAAGFSVDRFTLIFGALGVGIGFGLQNVVSNFVSGLILLFERPIQVGDRIQLTALEGVVMDIGMRASTVRSYSGADIVVPNANLISAEVVNWTLRDRTRRMEIPLGVAYGTDPDTVIGILTDVAKKHPLVADQPKPEALFMDFGESSLDFELRAWTAAGRHLGVSSELRLAITRALKEAKIEIPFPQRDLHVRSVVDTVNSQAG